MEKILELELKLKTNYKFLKNVDVNNLINSIENVLGITVDTLLDYPITKECKEEDFRPLEQSINGAMSLIRGIIETRVDEIQNEELKFNFTANLIEQVGRDLEGEVGLPFFVNVRGGNSVCELINSAVYTYCKTGSFDKAYLLVENLSILFQNIFCKECEEWLDGIKKFENRTMEESKLQANCQSSKL